MSQPTRQDRQNREQKYSSWDLEFSRQKRAYEKLNEEERRKTDPKCIREDKANSFTQSIYLEQKAIYENLYSKMEEKTNELYNLIIADLGLDQDNQKKLSSNDIIEVFNYYKNKGLNQIKTAITDEMIKNYFPKKMNLYQKLFKNLITLRAEFMIVAPKERLSLYMPYKKVKDDDVRVSLVKHLAELKILENYEFSKKFPELKKLYEDIKEKELNQ